MTTPNHDPNVMELQQRIQSLVESHARERSQLAEQISQLQEENKRLRTQLKAFQAVGYDLPNTESPNGVTRPNASVHTPLHFDFSITEQQP